VNSITFLAYSPAAIAAFLALICLIRGVRPTPLPGRTNRHDLIAYDPVLHRSYAPVRDKD
jgi:hypothetical protein